MGRYSATNFRRPKPRAESPHPIWRGIGCMLMILVPILSFAFAELTVQSTWAQQYIPYQLLGYPALPPSLWKVGLLNPALAFIQGLPNFYAALVFFFLFLVVIGTFVSVGNAYLYRAIAPSRYGPQDATQPRIKVKRYKR